MKGGRGRQQACGIFWSSGGDVTESMEKRREKRESGIGDGHAV